MKYLLVHSTNIRNLSAILDSKMLHPASSVPTVGYGEGSDEMRNDIVYFTMLFRDFLFHFPSDSDRAYLFFDFEALARDYPPLHMCHIWLWGKFEANECSPYDLSKSPRSNARQWEQDYIQYRPAFHPKSFIYGIDEYHAENNETVFVGSIPIERYLLFVYAPQIGSRPSQLKKFLQSCGYLDVDTISKHTIQYRQRWNLDMTEEEHAQEYQRLIDFLARLPLRSRLWKRWQSLKL
jgi:hypothetical protein